jgi:hypothetical protein
MNPPFKVRAIFHKHPWWWLPPYIADVVVGLTTTSSGERW